MDEVKKIAVCSDCRYFFCKFTIRNNIIEH